MVDPLNPDPRGTPPPHPATDPTRADYDPARVDNRTVVQSRSGGTGVMIAAVVITVILMMVASDPLARFIDRNPSIVMLALAFLVMIGLVLIADGFGFHVPKGYIYAAMGFSVAVELLNMASRNRRARKKVVEP